MSDAAFDALLDLVGRRWSLKIIHALKAGPKTSRGLRADLGLSPSVLQTRIDELRAAKLVNLGDGGYALTGMGRDLLTAMGPMGEYSQRWAKAANIEKALQ